MVLNLPLELIHCHLQIKVFAHAIHTIHTTSYKKCTHTCVHVRVRTNDTRIQESRRNTHELRQHDWWTGRHVRMEQAEYLYVVRTIWLTHVVVGVISCTHVYLETFGWAAGRRPRHTGRHFFLKKREHRNVVPTTTAVPMKGKLPSHD